MSEVDSYEVAVSEALQSYLYSDGLYTIRMYNEYCLRLAIKYKGRGSVEEQFWLNRIRNEMRKRYCPCSTCQANFEKENLI